MKKEKLTYLSPLTETFVIRFEGNVMLTASQTASGGATFDDPLADIDDQSDAYDWGW